MAAQEGLTGLDSRKRMVHDLLLSGEADSPEFPVFIFRADR
jgi:hypothetical protein